MILMSITWTHRKLLKTIKIYKHNQWNICFFFSLQNPLETWRFGGMIEVSFVICFPISSPHVTYLITHYRRISFIHRNGIWSHKTTRFFQFEWSQARFPSEDARCAVCSKKKRPFSVKNRLLSIRYEERKKSLDAITRLDVSVAFFLSRFFFSLKKNLLLGSKAVWFRSHHLWIVNATVCLCFFLFNLFSQLDVELGRMTSRYFVGAKNANTVPSFYYRVHKIHDQCSIQWEWKESHAEKRIGKN